MADGPWFGALGLGVGSLLTQIVGTLRGTRQADEAHGLDQLQAALDGLGRLVEAQGKWMASQAEQIVQLHQTADALQVRVVSTEEHAKRCDRQLVIVTDFIRSQGLEPPPL